jgi:hypothetical protein
MVKSCLCKPRKEVKKEVDECDLSNKKEIAVFCVLLSMKISKL